VTGTRQRIDGFSLFTSTLCRAGNGVNGGGCYGSVLVDNPGASPMSPGSANATTIATELPPLQNIDENWEKALAVVAHPDDLEYSAAAAIVRWTSQGKTAQPAVKPASTT
jgi:hypothetical protein